MCIALPYRVYLKHFCHVISMTFCMSMHCFALLQGMVDGLEDVVVHELVEEPQQEDGFVLFLTVAPASGSCQTLCSAR